ncbi:hypothetical protein B5J93_12965, partial [Moraxella equi]
MATPPNSPKTVKVGSLEVKQNLGFIGKNINCLWDMFGGNVIMVSQKLLLVALKVGVRWSPLTPPAKILVVINALVSNDIPTEL